MKHRTRISFLVVLFLILCVLTVMLFAALPDRTIGSGLSAFRAFGPDWPKNGLVSCRVTDELDPTLTLVFPKTGAIQ